MPEGTIKQYQYWLEGVGKILNWPDPRKITVQELESLEASMMGGHSESTVTVRMCILRDMLRFAGNKDIARFRPICSMQPAMDSVFLNEEQVAICRMRSRQMTIVHELLYSLMVDNGLRPVDIQRLTMDNARELLDMGQSMILGKGRKGGKLARLVLSPITREPLREYMTYRRTFKDHDSFPELFLVKYHGMTKPVSTQYIRDRVLEVTGKGIKSRDLRKTCGNRVYQLTRDIGMSAMILRHSSPNTAFRHYIGADASEMKAVQERLAKSCPAAPSQSTMEM